MARPPAEEPGASLPDPLLDEHAAAATATAAQTAAAAAGRKPGNRCEALRAEAADMRA
ncbi:MAG TPA: hypothetical protein VIV12_04805 [Streptosporangiaceae bacterium]